MNPAPFPGRLAWYLPVAVFLLVTITQLWLVARAGTDIPFQDQWDSEGHWLYPAWHEGRLHAADLFRPHNEHRIVWTHLLNLGLFVANGQWDPLVQQFCCALLHGAVVALLAALLARGFGSGAQWGLAAGIGVACLPIAGWHNALWGFQSQVYFALLFALLAFGWLAGAVPFSRSSWAGVAAVGAMFLAMGAGLLAPMAWLGVLLLRGGARRDFGLAWCREALLPVSLVLVASFLLVPVPEHAALHAGSAGQFIIALGRMLVWPHTGQPLAAVILNLPLVLAVGARLTGRRQAAPGEDLIVMIALWVVGIAAAAAWSRGGSAEFAAGVPSRYADLLVLLPLANTWWAVVLARESVRWRAGARLVATAWIVFLFVGWAGLSAEVMHRLILPRMRDRDAPVRLMQEFQRRGDAAVFTGQPRLLVPHPNLGSVTAVLDDPRLKGALPPSLQPERPLGPLSRAVRWLLGR